MIQATIGQCEIYNRFNLQRGDYEALASWARRNLGTLSEIVWFAYDQKRYKERRVGSNLVRQIHIDLRSYVGWVFL